MTQTLRQQKYYYYSVLLALFLLSFCLFASAQRVPRRDHDDDDDDGVDDMYQGRRDNQNNINNNKNNEKKDEKKNEEDEEEEDPEEEDDDEDDDKTDPTNGPTPKPPPALDLPPKEINIPSPIIGQNYLIEGAFVVVIIIYGINWLIGRSLNNSIAKAWVLAFNELLDENFSKIGETAFLIRHTPSLFRTHCTGRKNCVGAEITLSLIKRQDLLFSTLSFFLGNHDLITIDVPMAEGSMDNIFFAVVRKRDEKQFYKDNPNTKEFALSRSTELGKNFIVLSETEELVSIFLRPEVVSTIKTYEKYVQEIYFTDQFPHSKEYKKVLRFVFRLPPKKQMEKHTTLMKMIFHFMDSVPHIIISKAGRTRGEKIRARAREAAEKELLEKRKEEADKKKAEQQQKREEEIASLPVEEQRKIYDKEKKKAEKRKMSKAGKFKVMYA